MAMRAFMFACVLCFVSLMLGIYPVGIASEQNDFNLVGRDASESGVVGWKASGPILGLGIVSSKECTDCQFMDLAEDNACSLTEVIAPNSAIARLASNLAFWWRNIQIALNSNSGADSEPNATGLANANSASPLVILTADPTPPKEPEKKDTGEKEGTSTKIKNYTDLAEKGLKVFKALSPKKGTPKDSNAVFIDASKIDSDYYANLINGIRLEIFFLKKGSNKDDTDVLLNKVMDQIPELQESPYQEVVGCHVYQLLAKDTFTDQIAAQPSKGLIFCIVWCDNKIMHSQSLSWDGAKQCSIHIQLVGRDMYVQYGS